MAKAKAAPFDLNPVIDGYLAALAEVGWEAASLSDAAARAAMPLAEVAAHIGSRFDLLAAYGMRLNAAAIAAADADGGSQAPQDRLFALIMGRFDAAAPHKAAIRALSTAAGRDPGLACFFAQKLPQSMALLLDSAGLSATGLRGLRRVATLTVVYVQSVRVWLTDDSEDQSKTMAVVDKALKRIGRLL
jgi:COQ9